MRRYVPKKKYLRTDACQPLALFGHLLPLWRWAWAFIRPAGQPVDMRLSADDYCRALNLYDIKIQATGP